MHDKAVNLSDEEALQNFLLDIDCLDELLPWTKRFNLFDVLKISRTEIRHSNILSWLLNPNENHGLGDAFLKTIIQSVVQNDDAGKYNILETLLMDFYSFTVYREWKYIDLLLVSDAEKFLIAIENKIGSHEHDHQLKRYRRTLESSYPYYKKMLLYLTPEGEEPSDCDNWDILTYREIATTLNELQNTMDMAPAVSLVIGNYLDVIRRDIVEDEKLIEVCNKIYAKHVFRMYDTDEPITVQLYCHVSVMKYLIDNFGADFDVETVDDEHFKATVSVCASTTFYSWVFGFNGKIKISEPSMIKLGYKEMLQSALAEM